VSCTTSLPGPAPTVASTPPTHQCALKDSTGRGTCWPRNQDGHTPERARTSPSTRSQSCLMSPTTSRTNASRTEAREKEAADWLAGAHWHANHTLLSMVERSRVHNAVRTGPPPGFHTARSSASNKRASHGGPGSAGRMRRHRRRSHRSAPLPTGHSMNKCWMLSTGGLGRAAQALNGELLHYALHVVPQCRRWEACGGLC
jgi:hypothetical protein